MRILLINPHYPISETPSPPLGLAYIAATLEKAGIEVKILDFVVFPYSRNVLESALKQFSPRIVGVTAVTMNIDKALTIVRDVKHIDSVILTVIGGPHTSFYAAETMKTVPELDFIALGEGEKIIVDLAKEVKKGNTPNNVRCIVYRNGHEIRHTKMRHQPVDVNRIPVPVRHLIPLGRYRALHMPISMTTSRGCPFKCIFCVGRKMVGSKIRYRDSVNVVDELRYLTSLNFSQINIADDLFTANKNHCFSICDEIIKQKINAKWSSFARVDTVSPELMQKMKKAGCDSVSFGAESANATILKTIKKGITLGQVIDAIRMCTDAGITPHISFILGLPGETPETLAETQAFGEKIKAMGAFYGFHLLAPFPGTAVRDEHQKYGIKILTNDWQHYHANRAIVETDTVTKKMLDDIVIHWEDEYNQFLSYIKEQTKNNTATADEARQLKNLESTIIIYELMMKNMIEEKGTWPVTNKHVEDKNIIHILADRVNKAANYDKEKVFEVLNNAMAQGNLEYIAKNGMIQWKWVDYL